MGSRLDAYLETLPEGLASYPEYEAKASLYRALFDPSHLPFDPSELDARLRDYFDQPVPQSMWIRETVLNALFLTFADHMFEEDQRFIDYVYHRAFKTLKSPMYRVLMAVASPQQLARGAERRWQTFHRGITYDVTLEERGTYAVIRYPPYLYNRLLTECLAAGARAAYRSAGGSGTSYEVREWHPDHTVFAAGW